jgi:hypothetical protein
MKLVKIKLSDSPFWFLSKKLILNIETPFSSLLPVETFSEEEKIIINNSCRQGEIKLFDADGRRINNINDIVLFTGESSVGTNDDIEDEKELFPEIVSVTSGAEKLKKDEPQEIDYENAELLLSRNGSTIKKTLKEITKDSEGVIFLQACFEIERLNKQRPNILKLLKNYIMEAK